MIRLISCIITSLLLELEIHPVQTLVNGLAKNYAGEPSTVWQRNWELQEEALAI